MTTRRLIELAVQGSGCGDIRIVCDSVSVIAEFEYRGSGQDLIGRLEFRGVKVFRFADEVFASGLVRGAYDTVVEVDPSEWLQSLKQRDASLRHFACFFSSNGYLEVIGRSVVLGETRSGLL